MKKVALALTGGGVKSCVNIGVLRALEELNIEITAISGASMGGMVGFLYLSGYSPKEILKMFQEDIIKFEKFSLTDVITALPRFFVYGGLKKPQEIVEYVEKIEKEKNIKTLSDLDKALIIPALDISDRKVVYYSSKKINSNTDCFYDRPVSEAIRSSSAIPLFFTPYKIRLEDKNHFMLDGGILTNTLITPLKQFSDFTIGITNKFYPNERSRVNLFTGFTQTFQSMRRTFLSYEKQNADIWIEIDSNMNKFVGNAKEMEYLEELGYNETMKALKDFNFARGENECTD